MRTVRPDVDARDPEGRLARLFDAGSLRPLAARDDSGAFAARGAIDGREVYAYCTDASRAGGALSARGCGRIVAAIDRAVARRCPVIGIWHSGGALLTEGTSALDAVGRVFAAMTRASGRVPQVSVVLGPAAGGAAYGPALTDVVIMTEAGRVFVTGPEVVRSVTGETIDMVGLGGLDAQARRSGVVHLAAAGEDAAYARARQVTVLLAWPGRVGPVAAADAPDPMTYLPSRPQRAYDVRPVVLGLLDRPAAGDVAFHELQPRWAPNIVVGLGRLGGGAVGVVANNPLRKGGCLDALSAEKAARFVRMCDAFGVPLMVLVDVPGYLPGVAQEWDGVVRRGAKLLHAFAEAAVPRVTVLLRKSYGGAYIAMNSRSLGATAVYAWPSAEAAVMGARAAVGVLRRRELAAAPADEREALHTSFAAEFERTAGGVAHAVSTGGVDRVIEPSRTRELVAAALATAPVARGRHTNIPL